MVSDVPNWVLNQWRAWYERHHLVGGSLDPEFRDDVRVAKGFSLLANHWRKTKALQIEDLLPYPPEKPPQTAEQLQAALEARSNANKRKLDRKVTRGSQSNVDDRSKPVHKTRSNHRRSHQRVEVSKDSTHGDGEGRGVGTQ